VGDPRSHTVIAARSTAMPMNKMATGVVQAIHDSEVTT